MIKDKSSLYYKIDYNEKTRKELGWEPEWFGVDGSGSLNLLSDFKAQTLIKNIMTFQKKIGLNQDGLVGPMTYSRIYTERIAQEGDVFEVPGSESELEIIHDLDMYENFTKAYRTANRIKTDNINSIREIVIHWDATLSANHCINILKKRNISTHFIIDNDGTIIQLIPVKDVAYHAGNYNENSIGIDLSNAYYTKYNDWYIKNGFGSRPVIKSEVHGVKSTHLGYYPAQLDSLVALVNYLCKKYDIEKNVPLDDKGRLITTVFEPAVKKKFKGIICHYHLTKNKIDCQGLELDKLFPKSEEM